MYVSVKGGEKAIAHAHEWMAELRRGDTEVPELSLEQIQQQMRLAVDRVMAEGSLYDPELAALALKQTQGEVIEAIFLMRAYRTTLPRFGATRPIDTEAMRCRRRISATFKDVPGGQILGPTFDYSHRLLDFKLAAEGAEAAAQLAEQPMGTAPHITELLDQEGLIQVEPTSDETPSDITREPMEFPPNRAQRLQSLARADEGWLLGLAYSTQRGYASTHAFVGELRIGYVEIELDIPELGFAVAIGQVQVSECESVNQFAGSKSQPPQFTRGYGLVFGQSERKAISMALVDRALRGPELGQENQGVPAQDPEFALAHGDNIQATGFLEHIKLPHYVDFQAEVGLVRRMRQEHSE